MRAKQTKRRGTARITPPTRWRGERQVMAVRTGKGSSVASPSSCLPATSLAERGGSNHEVAVSWDLLESTCGPRGGAFHRKVQELERAMADAQRRVQNLA